VISNPQRSVVARQNGHWQVARRQSVSTSKHSHRTVFESIESVSVGADPQVAIPIAIQAAHLHVFDHKFQTSSSGSKQPFETANPKVTLWVIITPECAVVRTPGLKLFDRPASPTRDSIARADPCNPSTVLEYVEYVGHLYPKLGGEFRVGHAMRTIPHDESLS